MGSIDVAWLEELEIGDIGVVFLEIDHVLDVLHFAHDEWAVGVALAVNEGQDFMCFLPATLASEPARRFWEEDHSDEETNGGNHLETLYGNVSHFVLASSSSGF